MARFAAQDSRGRFLSRRGRGGEERARGRTMLGYCSTQSWDTMLTGLALDEAGAEQWPEMARGIFRFLEREQIRLDPLASSPPNKFL